MYFRSKYDPELGERSSDVVPDTQTFTIQWCGTSSEIRAGKEHDLTSISCHSTPLTKSVLFDLLDTSLYVDYWSEYCSQLYMRRGMYIISITS
jgi:hypothetical protein